MEIFLGLVSNWHVELSPWGFICDYWADCGILCSMHRSQSAQSRENWHSGIKILMHVVVVNYKQWVLFLRGHHGSTKSL